MPIVELIALCERDAHAASGAPRLRVTRGAHAATETGAAGQDGRRGMRYESFWQPIVRYPVWQSRPCHCIHRASNASFAPHPGNGTWRLAQRDWQLQKASNRCSWPAIRGRPPAETLFGTIPGTNITPQTGKGHRALVGGGIRACLARRHRPPRNPAFPCDHFTKLRDEDVAALHAFMMTRDPTSP